MSKNRTSMSSDAGEDDPAQAEAPHCSVDSIVERRDADAERDVTLRVAIETVDDEQAEDCRHEPAQQHEHLQARARVSRVVHVYL